MNSGTTMSRPVRSTIATRPPRTGAGDASMSFRWSRPSPAARAPLTRPPAPRVGTAMMTALPAKMIDAGAKPEMKGRSLVRARISAPRSTRSRTGETTSGPVEARTRFDGSNQAIPAVNPSACRFRASRRRSIVTGSARTMPSVLASASRSWTRPVRYWSRSTPLARAASADSSSSDARSLR